jgi:hypothetical protein
MPITTRTAAPAATVATHISGLRLTRHVARLLEVRDRLALYVTERESHNLDDVHDAFMAMVAVEDELAAQAPQVHAILSVDWATGCDVIAHEPGSFNSRCGICRGASAGPKIDSDAAPMVSLAA